MLDTTDARARNADSARSPRSGSGQRELAPSEREPEVALVVEGVKFQDGQQADKTAIHAAA